MLEIALFWLVGFGVLVLLLMPKIHRLVTEAYARTLRFDEVGTQSSSASGALQAAQRRLAAIEAIARDLAQKRTALKEQIAACHRDIAAPPREQFKLVYELGAPRTDGAFSLFAAIRIPSATQTVGGNIRQPDGEFWRQPRLVRVWGKGTAACLAAAEQRFGTRRDFQLLPIDAEQSAALDL